MTSDVKVLHALYLKPSTIAEVKAASGLPENTVRQRITVLRRRGLVRVCDERKTSVYKTSFLWALTAHGLRNFEDSQALWEDPELDTYQACGEVHPSRPEILCSKRAGHAGECLGWDNSVVWQSEARAARGGEPTKGKPVSWQRRVIIVHRAPPSPSGDMCPQCGSPNYIRTGSCFTCQDCGTNTGCG